MTKEVKKVTKKENVKKVTNVENSVVEVTKTEDKAIKREFDRKPIRARSVLEAVARDGYYRRWVNDTVGRIQMFIEAGYTFVKIEDSGISAGEVQNPTALDASCVRQVANKDLQEGMGRYAYLMEIPLEWWQQDQEAKARANFKIERESLPDKSYNFGSTLKNE